MARRTLAGDLEEVRDRFEELRDHLRDALLADHQLHLVLASLWVVCLGCAIIDWFMR